VGNFLLVNFIRDEWVCLQMYNVWHLLFFFRSTRRDRNSHHQGNTANHMDAIAVFHVL